jgi:hypothetical protein
MAAVVVLGGSARKKERVNQRERRKEGASWRSR